ncbi:MAG: cyclic nucleotide-binding domain-containing protein [Chthoniobacterales bacterium]
MPPRDFFVFCTSLDRIELRALGALSQVRHIPEGETIYSADEPAETLYIINRGIVEIVPDKSKRFSPAICLSRGDIFGDIEVLIDRLRPDTARARAAVSLQSFEKRDLPELLRRVPAFYRYLCENLALRLAQTRDGIGVRTNDLELSGNLAHFDLVTVYQTIAQSAQTGEMSILDERGELIAAFRFLAGRPLGGHFLHLSGEEAFWQLFLAENLRGSFSFSSADKKGQKANSVTILRGADDMLFAAVQFRDEFKALRQEMPATSVYEVRLTRASAPDQNKLPISASVLEEVWACVARRPTALSDIFKHCSLCELKIYQAVHELVRTGHLALASSRPAQKVA